MQSQRPQQAIPRSSDLVSHAKSGSNCPETSRSKKILAAVALLIAAISSSFLWSISSPSGASPDEPSHIHYAWGVISGQVFPWTLVQETSDSGASLAVITMPEKLEQLAPPSCYIGKAYEDECDPAIRGDGEITTTSYMARYPLLYYAVVGSFMKLGLSIGLSGFSTLILGRIASGMLSYFMIAYAAVLMKKRFGIYGATIPLIALLVPNAHFLMNSINPNGFEIAASAALAATVVAVIHDIHVHAQVSARLQVLLVSLVLVAGWIRPLSVAWTGLLLLLLILPIGRKRPAFLQLSKVTVIAILLLAGFLLSWFYWEATGTRTETTQGDISDWRGLPKWLQLGVVLSRFGELVQNGYGLLGWADTQLPIFSLILWLIVCAVTLAQFAAAKHSSIFGSKVSLGYLIGSMLVVTVESIYAGFGWQGRYWIPAIAIALVLLTPNLTGAALSSRHKRTSWLTLQIITTLLIVHALIYNLWRYQYGLRTPFVRFSALPFPTAGAEWSPAGGERLFYAVLAIGLLSYFLYVFLVVRLNRGVEKLFRGNLMNVSTAKTLQ